jgi:DNA-binding transcriptional regulator YiaG
MAETTAKITDKTILEGYKLALDMPSDAEFARWLGVSRQRLHQWLSGTHTVSDLWILQILNDRTVVGLKQQLAERLMKVHAAKARMN